jgi:hypothetical protein
LLYVDVPTQTGSQNIDIDVTHLVIHQFHNGNTGFVLQLLEEEIYRMVLFGSRENEGYVPVLELEFVDPNTRCDVFYGPNGLPTTLLNSNSTSTSTLDPNYFEIGSIYQPNLIVQRLALQPALNQLPPSINIVHASLRLNIFHPQQAPNTATLPLRLLPLIVPTPLANLNWNTQPPFSTANSAYSVSPESNFGVIHFDVKALIEQQFRQGQFTPWLLKQEIESSIGSSYLAGSGMNLPNVSPTLMVCYTTNVGLSEPESALKLSVYPNPVNDWLQVQVQNNEGQSVLIQITDATGKLCYAQKLENVVTGQMKWQLQTSQWPTGVYLLHLQTDQNLLYQRFVITR